MIATANTGVSGVVAPTTGANTSDSESSEASIQNDSTASAGDTVATAPYALRPRVRVEDG